MKKKKPVLAKTEYYEEEYESKVIKIIHEFADGSRKYIIGKELKKYLEGIKLSGICLWAHPGWGKIKPVKWRKEK